MPKQSKADNRKEERLCREILRKEDSDKRSRSKTKGTAGKLKIKKGR